MPDNELTEEDFLQAMRQMTPSDEIKPPVSKTWTLEDILRMLEERGEDA